MHEGCVPLLDLQGGGGRHRSLWERRVSCLNPVYRPYPGRQAWKSSCLILLQMQNSLRCKGILGKWGNCPRGIASWTPELASGECWPHVCVCVCIHTQRWRKGHSPCVSVKGSLLSRSIRPENPFSNSAQQQFLRSGGWDPRAWL